MQASMRDWRLPVLVVVGFLFARTSEGRLPYFLFYFALATLLIAWLWTHYALRKITCMVQLGTERVEVGQSLGVRVRLDNDTLFPLPWIEMDDATPEHLVSTDLPKQATSVPLMGSRILQFKVTAKRRGHYPIGPIRVQLGDAFGFFEGKRQFLSKQRVTVYPRIHQIEGLPVPLSQPFGPVRTRERAFEDPSNQAEIREYRPGDNPRHIHWKTSARRGQLMLREYEINATTTMALFPDLHSEAHVQEAGLSTEEMTVEIAASLAHLGMLRQIEVGMLAHVEERYQVVTGRGARTFYEVLEVLARVEASGRLPIESVLERETAHLGERSTIVVITPRLTPHLADLLIRLRAKHQVMLIHLSRESFGSAQGPAEAEVEQRLRGLLLLRRVAVYAIGAGDDIRRLSELRLTGAQFGQEGERVWREEQPDRPPAINS